MQTRVWWVAMGVMVTAAAGCGAAGPPTAQGPIVFPSEPLTTLPSAEARYQVEVRTSPQPPVKGVNAVELRISDAAGALVDGLTIAATPWMPAHGHGGRATTVVEPEGDGAYRITNVYLYMEGSWELRSTLTSLDGEDAVTPVFDVR
jgi:hypothetical protein